MGPRHIPATWSYPCSTCATGQDSVCNYCVLMGVNTVVVHGVRPLNRPIPMARSRPFPRRLTFAYVVFHIDLLVWVCVWLFLRFVGPFVHPWAITTLSNMAHNNPGFLERKISPSYFSCSESSWLFLNPLFLMRNFRHSMLNSIESSVGTLIRTALNLWGNWEIIDFLYTVESFYQKMV